MHAPRAAVPPWGLAIAAMLSVQLGSALSVGLIGSVGPAGTAWLRLTFGAVVFLAIARPPLRAIRRADLLTLLGLGITTGLTTTGFLAAIDRVPLGTAVAIEFLGPLTVAGIRSHSARALVWPGLALVGVLLLTEPWRGDIDPIGVGFAALAAVGWAVYILLTQRVGDRFTGVRALAPPTPSPRRGRVPTTSRLNEEKPPIRYSRGHLDCDRARGWSRAPRSPLDRAVRARRQGDPGEPPAFAVAAEGAVVARATDPVVEVQVGRVDVGRLQVRDGGRRIAGQIHLQVADEVMLRMESAEVVRVSRSYGSRTCS